MLNTSESLDHRKIKLALAEGFRNKNWIIKHIDGENDQTDVVDNKELVGDQENKRPDIDAKDEYAKRIIRGEAKVNNGDFDSEHSITQYKLFSCRELDGIASWLIIGVPNRTKAEMDKVLDREVKRGRENIAVWEYQI
jgi:hypothetical protein